MKELSIVISQLNFIAGDIVGNTEKIAAAATAARDQQQAHLIIFPEMALTGYPLKDLLVCPELPKQIAQALQRLKRIKNICMVLGLPLYERQKVFNAALVLQNGTILARYHKAAIAHYGPFAEGRYFSSSTLKIKPFRVAGHRFAVTIGDDLLQTEVRQQISSLQIEALISIDALAFNHEQSLHQRKLLTSQAKKLGLPLIYVNLIGGMDEFVLAGGSLVSNAQEQEVKQLPFFAEASACMDFNLIQKRVKSPQQPTTIPSPIALLYSALVLSVKDYLAKNHFTKALVSLSGGIDSALTLAIVVDALGSTAVETFYLPSRYSSKLSEKITQEQTKMLNVKHSTVSIEPLIQPYLQLLPKQITKIQKNYVAANLQARARANFMMMMANYQNALVISTGNKSESSVGYATLYGDMAGGFAVLRDISKTLVYQLVDYRNTLAPVIPQAAILRAPTAELYRGQKDADDLPPYPELDEILARYLRQKETKETMIAAGFNATSVEKVLQMLHKSQYKRQQAPLGPKLTDTAFGNDICLPVTSQ